MSKSGITLAFLGNINYDSRCRNLFNSLRQAGFDTSFIGFDWLTENLNSVNEKNIYVKKLTKKISIVFYLKFAFLLTSQLVSSKSKIFFAEDVLTLPIVSAIAFFKRGKVIYDSRELYGYLAGLSEKKFTQWLLKIIEALFIKKVDLIIVTGNLDRDFIAKKYNVKNILVVRNLPLLNPIDDRIDLHELFQIDKKIKILLYQGVVLHGRGLKILMDIMPKLENFALVVIGKGEQFNYYKSLVEKKNLSRQVFLLGKVDNAKLFKYTSGAFIGTSLIENLSLSYYYALPNKLFEYIMCGVPALVSKLPQMEEIICQYNVGRAVDISNQAEIISAIHNMSEKIVHDELVQNCKKASLELNWEKEIKSLIQNIQSWC